MINGAEQLKGKKILLFAVYTFNYQYIICDKLKELGALVTLYDERTVSNTCEKALLKVDPYIFKNKTRKYYNRIIHSHSGENFNYILFIKCDMPDHTILSDLRNAFPNAKMCLHVWDSIANIPHILDKVKFFDYATSFDRKDCLEYPEFKFRPLFYSDDFRNPLNQNDYIYDIDISFCGTIHSDRYKILKDVEEQCKKNGMKYYGFYYIQSKLVHSLYKLLKSEFRHTKASEFAFDKLTSKEIIDIVNMSRAVVDIQHPKQSGLTMRTIEMLGMKKKLITTNTDIVNYDFYNQNNVYIINRSNPIISKDFLESSYCDIEEEIYDRYSLESWICDVLGIY